MNRRKFFKVVAAAGVAAAAPAVAMAAEEKKKGTVRQGMPPVQWARICQQNMEAVTKSVEEAMLFGNSTLRVTDIGLRKTTVRVGLPKDYWHKMTSA